MASKQTAITNKLLEELKCVLGEATYTELYSKWQNDLNVLDFINKGLRIIKWKNLPTGIDPRILNINLFFRGKVVLFTHETLGNFALPMVRYGGTNAYGIMTHIHPVAVGEQGNELNVLELEEDINAVVLRINDLEVAPVLYATYYGRKTSETLDCIDNNNMWLKFPIVIKSTGNEDLDKKNSLVVKEMLEQKGMKFPVITSAIDGIELLNLKPQYFGLELFEQLKSWKNMYYEYLGVNHHEEKKERLTDEEVANNQEEASVNSNKILQPLKECIDKANKIFGWNIQVELDIENTGLYNQDVRQEITSKGVR